MRLSKQKVAEREEFALAQFKAGKSIEDVQELLRKRDGSKMTPKRIEELFGNHQTPVVPETTQEKEFDQFERAPLSEHLAETGAEWAEKPARLVKPKSRFEVDLEDPHVIEATKKAKAEGKLIVDLCQEP